MKFSHIVLLVLSTMAISQTAPPKTVARVDLDRYAGKWYEIARFPNRFEKDCVSDVTAEYKALTAGKIEVVNSCRRRDGKVKQSRGSAKVVDTTSNAKLKVTFFWPFYGNYWVIELAPDYSYAVVGDPDRKYLWILSRTPELSAETYGKIEERIRQQGYDPGTLVKTAQKRQSAS